MRDSKNAIKYYLKLGSFLYSTKSCNSSSTSDMYIVTCCCGKIHSTCTCNTCSFFFEQSPTHGSSTFQKMCHIKCKKFIKSNFFILFIIIENSKYTRCSRWSRCSSKPSIIEFETNTFSCGWIDNSTLDTIRSSKFCRTITWRSIAGTDFKINISGKSCKGQEICNTNFLMCSKGSRINSNNIICSISCRNKTK